jgi:hypothetical protein
MSKVTKAADVKQVQDTITNHEATIKSSLKELRVDGTNAEDHFMFSKQNYYIMGIGLILIALGFILMAGGKNDNPNIFDPKEIYSTTRITVAPILVVLGFIVEVVAIMFIPKQQA